MINHLKHYRHVFFFLIKENSCLVGCFAETQYGNKSVELAAHFYRGDQWNSPRRQVLTEYSPYSRKYSNSRHPQQQTSTEASVYTSISIRKRVCLNRGIREGHKGFTCVVLDVSRLFFFGCFFFAVDI